MRVLEGVADPVGWLTPPHQLAAWTAAIDGQPVGHVTLTKAAADDEVAQAWHHHTHDSIERLAIPARLFVDPDHRRQGVGGLLMGAIQQHALDHKRALAFDVMLKDQAAIRLYEEARCLRIGIINYHHSNGLIELAAVYVVPAA